jgi:hypothetical protein
VTIVLGSLLTVYFASMAYWVFSRYFYDREYFDSVVQWIFGGAGPVSIVLLVMTLLYGLAATGAALGALFLVAFHFNLGKLFIRHLRSYTHSSN